MKSRKELQATLKQFAERRPALALEVDEGRLPAASLLMHDRGAAETEAQLAALDRAEASKAAVRASQPRRGAAKGEPDYQAQRQILLDLRDKLQGELHELAERRTTLTLDVQLGKAPDDELVAVEQQQLAKTNEVDRLATSLAELDRREAASAAQQAAADRKRRQRDLDGLVARLGPLGSSLADHVAAMVPLLAQVDEVESAILAAAGGLSLKLPDGERRRPLLAKALLCLGVAAPDYYLSPADVAHARERLRQAPTLRPAPGQHESTRPPGPVPFAPGEAPPVPDPVATATIAAQEERAELMKAGR